MARPDPSKRSMRMMLAGIIIGAGLMLAGVEVFHHVEHDAHSGGVSAPVAEKPSQQAATMTPKPHTISPKTTAKVVKHKVLKQQNSAKAAGKAAAAASTAHHAKKKLTKKEKHQAVEELAEELKKAQAQLKKSEVKNAMPNKLETQGKTPSQILDWAQKSAPTDEAKRVVQEARGAVREMEKAALKAANKAHVDVDRLQAAADKELAASEASTEFEVVSENADNSDTVQPLETEDPPATWLLSGTVPSPMHNQPFGKISLRQMKGEGFTVPDDISPSKKKKKKEAVVAKLSKNQEEKMSPSQILRWAAKHAESAVAKHAVQNARKVLSKMHATASKAKSVVPAAEEEEEDESEELIEEEKPNEDVVNEAADEAVEEVMSEETKENAKSTKAEADELANEESELVVSEMEEEKDSK